MLSIVLFMRGLRAHYKCHITINLYTIVNDHLRFIFILLIYHVIDKMKSILQIDTIDVNNVLRSSHVDLLC